MVRKILLVSGTTILSLVFIVSAYLKLYPIEPFEWNFVDAGVSNWKLAPFFARTLIGIEFIIGGMLFFNLCLKKITYKLCYIILSFFIVYLIIQILSNGNEGNCGCFGSDIKITPLQAIIKNVFMLGLVYILQRFHKGIDYGKYTKDILLVVITSSLIAPYVLNPVDLEHAEKYLNKEKEGYKLDLNILYDNALLNTPPKSLSEGKHVLAFLSLTCPHCRLATKKIRIIHDRHPEIPFYFVLNGKEEELEEFFADTRAADIPFCRLRGQNFLDLAGLQLPVIYLLNNSVVEHSVDYNFMDDDMLLEWLSDK